MSLSRYQRQMLLSQVGPAGQERLAKSRVLLVGCGALGTVAAEQLTRAGVGSLIIADRDVVELTNLQRQTLFDEEDAAQGLPKAVAATRRLKRINSQTRVEPLVVDVNATNIEQIANSTSQTQRVDLIVDGSDNAQTRYLINDVSVKHGTPWIYGACVGTEGRFAAFQARSACLRCVFPGFPSPGELATCDTVGVLAPVAAIVGSLQAAAALELLLGSSRRAELITVQLWPNRFTSISLDRGRREDCACCRQRRFEFLDAASSPSVALCGRNSVQVQSGSGGAVELSSLANRLRAAGTVRQTPYLVRCDLHDPASISLTVFADGRAIIHGVSQIERARAIYCRFIGE